MTILVSFSVAAGLLLSGLSLPLIWRKVGPNPWYGFRVRQTLEDPAVWYPVNAFAARGLLCVGLGTSSAPPSSPSSPASTWACTPASSLLSCCRVWPFALS